MKWGSISARCFQLLTDGPSMFAEQPAILILSRTCGNGFLVRSIDKSGWIGLTRGDKLERDSDMAGS